MSAVDELRQRLEHAEEAYVSAARALARAHVQETVPGVTPAFYIEGEEHLARGELHEACRFYNMALGNTTKVR